MPVPSEDHKPEKLRRHSFGGTPSDDMASNPKAAATSSAQKRSLFGKMKDAVIGTKEEREAEKKRSAQVRSVSDVGLLWRSAEFIFCFGG